MTTTTATDWVWITSKGHRVDVVPADWPAEFEWFAEGPGQRPPQFYDLRNLTTGEVAETVVFPYEPWSPADAISDKLRAWGWTDTTTYDDAGTCEHGLSASLCAGPGHYPMDGDR